MRLRERDRQSEENGKQMYEAFARRHLRGDELTVRKQEQGSEAQSSEAETESVSKQGHSDPAAPVELNAKSPQVGSQRQYEEAGLNPQQRRFVDNYCISFKAKEAAIKAGYSVKTAAVIGHGLLNRPNIAAEIQRRQAALRAKFDVSEEKIIREAAYIAFSNMEDFMRADKDGAPLLDFSRLTHEQAAALGEVSIEEFKDGRSDRRQVRRIKFKKESKIAALELLAKIMGLSKERVNHHHDHQHSVLGLILEEIDSEARTERARMLLPSKPQLTVVRSSPEPNDILEGADGPYKPETPHVKADESK
jgi:phage terminase small subunit